MADRETVLPSVAEGETLACRELEPKGHTTQPPSRFTEAALTKALEERGIGRPSTYASIIDTILARNYVFKKSAHWCRRGRRFPFRSSWRSICRSWSITTSRPRWKTIWTRSAAARPSRPIIWAVLLRQRHSQDLRKQLDHKVEEIDAREVCSIRARHSRRASEPVTFASAGIGPYIEHGDRRASIPDDLPPDELTLQRCMELLDQAKQAEEPLGIDPETKKPVFLKNGRFGPYVQLGTADDEEKPKMSSLLKGMQPGGHRFGDGAGLLSLPRIVGNHPAVGRADCRAKRPVRPVYQVRRANSVAASRHVAARRDARRGAGAARAAEDARRGGQ